MNSINIISIILAIICVVIIILSAIKTDILRETKDIDSIKKSFSFSRFQLWIWTLVISPAFILNWGFNALNEPSLNITCLILLGIPAGVSLTAGIITDFHKSAKKELIKRALTEEEKKVLKEDTLKTELDSKSFWTDILQDDSGQISIVRLQQLIFTIAYVIIFVSSFFANNMVDYPEFNETAFVLMGISTSTYLIGKASKK